MVHFLEKPVAFTRKKTIIAFVNLLSFDKKASSTTAKKQLDRDGFHCFFIYMIARARTICRIGIDSKTMNNIPMRNKIAFPMATLKTCIELQIQ